MCVCMDVIIHMNEVVDSADACVCVCLGSVCVCVDEIPGDPVCVNVFSHEVW